MDPLWSDGETHALLGIRAEIDPDFPEEWQDEEEEEGSDVGDAYMWELISSRMKERGYTRNPQQCKAYWKFLLSRYTTHLQGIEATEEAEELMKAKIPLYKEMQVIFNARMQRMLWLVAAGCRSSTSAAGYNLNPLLEKGEEDGGKIQTESEKKRKTKRGDRCHNMAGRITRSMNRVREMMEEMWENEMAWVEVYQERRAKARDKDKEWWRRMEAMEQERKRTRMVWKEKEKQWRMRAHKQETRTCCSPFGLLLPPSLIIVIIFIT